MIYQFQTKKTKGNAVLKSKPRVLRVVAGVLMLALTSIGTSSRAEDGAFAFLGYAQVTAEHEDSAGGIDFGADAIRLKSTYTSDIWSAGIMVDLNAGDLSARAPGTLPNVIKDVYVIHAISPIIRSNSVSSKRPLAWTSIFPDSPCM